MSENKYISTREEQRWCRETMDRIVDLIPNQYTGVAQHRLKKQGIEVSSRYITDCKNLRRFDSRVVTVLEQMTRDLGKKPKYPSQDELKQKYFNSSSKR